MKIEFGQILIVVIGVYYFVFGSVSAWTQMISDESRIMLGVMIFSLMSMPGILLVIIGYLLYLDMKEKGVKVLSITEGNPQ